ncbi:MAG: trypsin-like peptidase domain-containing protein [Vampirovibrionales bacterium]|nr:trypsin-like peptidase domain-containing protein [Vampirovibrionales bacterium]
MMARFSSVWSKKWLPVAVWGVLLAGSLGVAGGVVLEKTGALLALQALAPQEQTFSYRHLQTVANDANAKSRRLSPAMLGMNPNLIADVAELLAPSVVNIDVSKSVGGRGGQYPEGLMPFPFGDGLMERFFGFSLPEPSPQEMPFRGSPRAQGRAMMSPQVMGNGSGVILDKQGHILTNYHVVDGANNITVTLKDGRKLAATVVGRDRFSDLVVLKVNAPNLQPATFGNSDKLRPGEWVIAVGSPLGFDHTVTLGIISAISRQVPDLNANVEFIQTDAAINPGNSGGPLVNLRGEVVGINTAIAGRGQNIGFAIPVDVVKQVADNLITHGKIQRPWLGLAMMDMAPDVAQSLGLPEKTPGVVVARVMPDSPAERAGFQQGDVIQRVEGKMVTSAKAIQDLVRNATVSKPIHMQILRNGALSAVTVTTDQLPSEPSEGSRG